MLNELVLGVLRSVLCVSWCALGDEWSLEFSGSLERECDCLRTGEEAGRSVAEAVSSDSRCNLAERFAPAVFVDGGSDGDAMPLECSVADLSKSLRSMVAVISSCCHSKVQRWCFKQTIIAGDGVLRR